jgi:flagellar biosynthesis protein FliR
MYTLPLTEQNRKEVIQEVIDRMLYLPSKRREVFMEILMDSFDAFPLEHEVNDRGIKVFVPVREI